MIKILFIGNSFTYFNDLPKMLEKIAQESGQDVYCDSVTKGGAFLHQYADENDELGKRFLETKSKEEWDYAVLQDQSFNPIGNTKDFEESALSLCKHLEKCKKIFFYQTWSYKDESEKLKNTGLSYNEMYKSLKTAYSDTAKKAGGIIVPVGDSFKKIKENHPEIEIYKEDSYHPNVLGTYLSACTFYAYIFDKSPENLTEPQDTNPELTKIIRKAATEVYNEQHS